MRESGNTQNGSGKTEWQTGWLGTETTDRRATNDRKERQQERTCEREGSHCPMRGAGALVARQLQTAVQ